jgi:hypothetical protein
MASLEDLTVDQLLARAKETTASHELIQTLSRNPETREMLQRAIKKANPNIPIPEIDKEDKVMAALENERKEREKLANQIQERDIRERVERERASIKDKYHLTEDDMKGVEALMVKTDSNPEPIPFYDAAARVFKAGRTPSVPSPSLLQPPTYTMPEKDVWGKGIGNPAQLNRIAMEQAFTAFNDIRSGKVAQ